MSYGTPNWPEMDTPLPSLREILDRAIQSHDRVNQSRRDALNARFDRIIQELETIDDDWWIHYNGNTKLMSLYMHLRKGVGEAEERRLWAEIITIKRDMVASYIVPAIYAAVRAGFVQSIMGAKRDD